MGKIFKKIALSAALVLLMPFLVFAVNDVSFNGITSFQLYTIDGTPVLTSIVAGSTTAPWQQVTSLSVQSNYIDVTLDNLSSITFNTTAANKYLQITKQSGSDNYTISPACVTSQATLTGTGAQVVLRVEVTSTVPGCAAAPGGGGVSNIFPTNYFAVINDGASCTESSNVTLTLSAQYASEVIVSNNANFIGSNWEPFTGYLNKSWTLEPGDGWKTVYVLYRS